MIYIYDIRIVTGGVTYHLRGDFFITGGVCEEEEEEVEVVVVGCVNNNLSTFLNTNFCLSAANAEYNGNIINALPTFCSILSCCSVCLSSVHARSTSSCPVTKTNTCPSSSRRCMLSMCSTACVIYAEPAGPDDVCIYVVCIV